MNNKISTLEEKMKNVEQSRQFDSDTFDSLQAKQGEIDSTLKKLQQTELQQKEKLLDLQSLEMRDNLILYKILEQRNETGEECEWKIRRLLENELKLPQARDICFHMVHRMGRFNRNKTRQIVAKFAFYPEGKQFERLQKIWRVLTTPLGNNSLKR